MFVAPAEVENSINTFMEECGFAPETWKLNSLPCGKDFQVQLLQNAFSSANHVKTVCSKLKDENGNFRTFMVKTVTKSNCQTRDWKRPKWQQAADECYSVLGRME